MECLTLITKLKGDVCVGKKYWLELMHPVMVETSDYISMYMSGDKWHVIKSRKGSDFIVDETEHNQLLSESLNPVCLHYGIVRTGADSRAIL